MIISKLNGNRLLVKRDESQTMTNGGIYIPENLITKRNTGMVVMLGEKANKVFKDRRVMFQSVAGEEVEHNNEPHLLIFAIEVIAIL